MNKPKPFKLGVVEGFFGKPWSWQARTDYASFLSKHGFNSYLYAPKNDVFLRKQWQAPMPTAELKALSKLCHLYTSANLDFGIGLSPVELYRHFNTQAKAQLKDKIQSLNDIGGTTLCLLFDDMQGDFANLAQQQAEIMHVVAQYSHAKNIILCPTYYSYDPQLTTHFGPMPKNYLEDLGRLIPTHIDIFWTGPKVISKDFPNSHLQEVSERLKRKPLLWDNYPVNDSQKLSQHLHLRPFKNRSLTLKEQCAGHMLNPMNQAHLSQLALFSLNQIYQNSQLSNHDLYHKACITLCGNELGEMLFADTPAFQEQGLTGITNAAKQKLITRYQKYQYNPLVQEILGWLNDEYAFDPACLT